MWLIGRYRPVTLFSLKGSLATGSGAKTLLVPTPFAIRTALLDAAIRTEGLEASRQAFPWIKGLRLAIHPPEQVVVTNLFAKILKPTRKEETEDADIPSAFDRTIAFREYAHQEGALEIAFEPSDLGILSNLRELIGRLNYFGKRGSFVQWMPPAAEEEALPPAFIRMSGPEFELPAAGVIQQVDDWGESLTFEKLDIYSSEGITLHKDRVLRPLVLPYEMVRSSKGFSHYRRRIGP